MGGSGAEDFDDDDGYPANVPDLSLRMLLWVWLAFIALWSLARPVIDYFAFLQYVIP